MRGAASTLCRKGPSLSPEAHPQGPAGPPGPACAISLGLAAPPRSVPSQDCESVSVLLCSIENFLLCVCTRSSCFIIQEVFKLMLNLVSHINIFKSQLIGKLQ